MIPAAFDYTVAESAEHAIQLLGEGGDEAKLLAGGHSLIPMMRFRLATPTMLIDVGRLNELSYIRQENGYVAIGAMTTVVALAIATFGYSIYLSLTPQTTLSGAAGSVLATLVWLYVLAQVYVGGSVLTRAIHEHTAAGADSYTAIDDIGESGGHLPEQPGDCG